MSFVHMLVCGHFAEGALERREKSFSRAIPADVIDGVLSRFPMLDAARVERAADHVVVKWVPGSPEQSALSKAFAIALAAEDGCVAADLAHCRVIHPEGLQIVPARPPDVTA